MTFSQAYSENVTGDRFSLYLNAAISKDYYFEYALTKKDGDMKIFSEDEDFTNKLSALKSDKRKYKNFVYELTDNRVFISKFLKLFSSN
jgi:glutamate-1-semialdehyde aminotransferase